MESQVFSLRFMSATQQGQLSHLLEYETDWKEVMQILLNSLDTFPTNTSEVEKLGSEKLEEWALTQEGGEELQLKVGVIISEKKYYKSDTLKCLRLIFNDLFKTVVLFNVRKKNVMRTLKMIAAEMISSRLSDEEDVHKLEVPRSLYPDIATAFTDSWRVRPIDTSPRKRKVAQMMNDNLKTRRDCPYCGRANFKRLISHITRNTACHVKYKVQMEYDFVQNNCFW